MHPGSLSGGAFLLLLLLVLQDGACTHTCAFFKDVLSSSSTVCVIVQETQLLQAAP